jgi:rare lipoprotein A
MAASESRSTNSKKVIEGISSYYGPKFHGKLTASGEVFDMYQLTAAHKSLKFGTRIKVINLDNNKHVIVKINDRGPFIKGRVLDLSYGAAKKLDMLKTGTARVRIEILDQNL